MSYFSKARLAILVWKGWIYLMVSLFFPAAKSNARPLAIKALFAVSLGITAALSAHAQTVEGSIYYYTDAATINTDISGNDVVLGKTPGGTFADAKGDTNILTPYTVTVEAPANITGNSNNYNDGYYGFQTYNNTTLNINGGNIGFTAWGFDTSTININGGKVHDATSSGGTVNIKGGTTDVSYSNGSKGVVNISGGTVGTATGFFSLRGSGTFNVTGGTISGGQYSYLGSGILNVFGGTVTSTISGGDGEINLSGGTSSKVESGGAAINITGGTMGDIGLSGFSVLNVSGSGFATSAANERWSYDYNYGALGRVADYSITGNLADGTAFSKTVTAAASGATLSADSVQLQGQAFELAPDLYVTDNGSVNNAIYNSVNIGTNSDGSVSTSPAVTLDTGLEAGDVYISNTSNVTMTGGKVDDIVEIFNDGAFNVTGGTVGGVFIDDAGQANVSGGNVSYVVGSGSSTINITGGTVGEVDAYISTVANISGGSIKDIYGGDDGIINLTGGTIGTDTIRMFGNGILNVFGTNLSFKQTSSGKKDGFGAYTGYLLFGTLTDGNVLNGVNLFDYDGGHYITGSDPTNTLLYFNGAGISVAAPEPGTFAFLLPGIAMGAAFLRRRMTKA